MELGLSLTCRAESTGNSRHHLMGWDGWEWPSSESRCIERKPDSNMQRLSFFCRRKSELVKHQESVYEKTEDFYLKNQAFSSLYFKSDRCNCGEQNTGSFGGAKGLLRKRKKILASNMLLYVRVSTAHALTILYNKTEAQFNMATVLRCSLSVNGDWGLLLHTVTEESTPSISNLTAYIISMPRGASLGTPHPWLSLVGSFA